MGNKSSGGAKSACLKMPTTHFSRNQPPADNRSSISRSAPPNPTESISISAETDNKSVERRKYNIYESPLHTDNGIEGNQVVQDDSSNNVNDLLATSDALVSELDETQREQKLGGYNEFENSSSLDSEGHLNAAALGGQLTADKAVKTTATTGSTTGISKEEVRTSSDNAVDNISSYEQEGASSNKKNIDFREGLRLRAAKRETLEKAAAIDPVSVASGCSSAPRSEDSLMPSTTSSRSNAAVPPSKIEDTTIGTRSSGDAYVAADQLTTGAGAGIQGSSASTGNGTEDPSVLMGAVTTLSQEKPVEAVRALSDIKASLLAKMGSSSLVSGSRLSEADASAPATASNTASPATVPETTVVPVVASVSVAAASGGKAAAAGSENSGTKPILKMLQRRQAKANSATGAALSLLVPAASAVVAVSVVPSSVTAAPAETQSATASRSKTDTSAVTATLTSGDTRKESDDNQQQQQQQVVGSSNSGTTVTIVLPAVTLTSDDDHGHSSSLPQINNTVLIKQPGAATKDVIPPPSGLGSGPASGSGLSLELIPPASPEETKDRRSRNMLAAPYEAVPGESQKYTSSNPDDDDDLQVQLTTSRSAEQTRKSKSAGGGGELSLLSRKAFLSPNLLARRTSSGGAVADRVGSQLQHQRRRRGISSSSSRERAQLVTIETQLGPFEDYVRLLALPLSEVKEELANCDGLTLPAGVSANRYAVALAIVKKRYYGITPDQRAAGASSSSSASSAPVRLLSVSSGGLRDSISTSRSVSTGRPSSAGRFDRSRRASPRSSSAGRVRRKASPASTAKSPRGISDSWDRPWRANGWAPVTVSRRPSSSDVAPSSSSSQNPFLLQQQQPLTARSDTYSIYSTNSRSSSRPPSRSRSGFRSRCNSGGRAGASDDSTMLRQQGYGRSIRESALSASKTLSRSNSTSRLSLPRLQPSPSYDDTTVSMSGGSQRSTSPHPLFRQSGYQSLTASTLARRDVIAREHARVLANARRLEARSGSGGSPTARHCSVSAATGGGVVIPEELRLLNLSAELQDDSRRQATTATSGDAVDVDVVDGSNLLSGTKEITSRLGFSARTSSVACGGAYAYGDDDVTSNSRRVKTPRSLAVGNAAAAGGGRGLRPGDANDNHNDDNDGTTRGSPSLARPESSTGTVGTIDAVDAVPRSARKESRTTVEKKLALPKKLLPATATPNGRSSSSLSSSSSAAARKAATPIQSVSAATTTTSGGGAHRSSRIANLLQQKKIRDSAGVTNAPGRGGAAAGEDHYAAAAAAAADCRDNHHGHGSRGFQLRDSQPSNDPAHQQEPKRSPEVLQAYLAAADRAAARLNNDETLLSVEINIVEDKAAAQVAYNLALSRRANATNTTNTTSSATKKSFPFPGKAGNSNSSSSVAGNKITAFYPGTFPTPPSITTSNNSRIATSRPAIGDDGKGEVERGGGGGEGETEAETDAAVARALRAFSEEGGGVGTKAIGYMLAGKDRSNSGSGSSSGPVLPVVWDSDSDDDSEFDPWNRDRDEQRRASQTTKFNVTASAEGNDGDDDNDGDNDDDYGADQVIAEVKWGSVRGRAGGQGGGGGGNETGKGGRDSPTMQISIITGSPLPFTTDILSASTASSSAAAAVATAAAQSHGQQRGRQIQIQGEYDDDDIQGEYDDDGIQGEYDDDGIQGEYDDDDVASSLSGASG